MFPARPDKDTSHLLQAGTYTYRFAWMLPKNVPGSYEETQAKATPLMQGFGSSGSINLASGWVIPDGGIIPRHLMAERSFIRYTATAVVEVAPPPPVRPE